MHYSPEKLAALKERWETPKGKALLKTIKKSRCYLSPVLFKEKALRFKNVNDNEVSDGIDLRCANLSGFDFRTIIKDGDESIIENIAILSGIHFEGANLKHCIFDEGRIHDCHFEDSDVSHAEFKSAAIVSCNFKNADATGMNLRGAKLIDCNFDNTEIKDITLDTTIVDQKTTFGSSLKSESDKNFHFASIEYKQIKEMYKNSSLHDRSDHYHYREMVAKRMLEPKTSMKWWLNFFFGDMLCKYGTSFSRVLAWSVGVIVLCAFLLNMNGSILHQNGTQSTSFLDSLYFSIVTFTTLGYGDYHAIGAMRFIAATEAFIGSALLALFTVIVARNIIRD